MFGKEIKKTISIEGMSCKHCASKVEKALKEMQETKKVKVDLENKKAEVILKTEVENEKFKNVIEELGYTVTNIH